jgi:hypothetical protein
MLKIFYTDIRHLIKDICAFAAVSSFGAVVVLGLELLVGGA